jgi:tetratricopeptide (TPR) repeat protein
VLQQWLANRAPDAEEAAIGVRLLRLRGRFEEARLQGNTALAAASGPEALRLRMELALVELADGRSEALQSVGAEFGRCLEAQIDAQPALRALAYSVLATLEMMAGRQEQSLLLAERSVLIADTVGEPVTRVETRLRLAWAHNMVARSGPSLSRLEEALALAQQHSLALLAANCWLRKAYALAHTGHSSEGLQAVRRCVALAPVSADLRLCLLARLQLVSMLLRRGLTDEAGAVCRGLPALGEQLNSGHLSAEITLVQSLCAWGEGKPSESVSVFEPLVLGPKLQALSPYHRAFHRTYFTERLLLVGRHEEAQRHLKELDTGQPWSESFSLLMAQSYLMMGRRQECIAALKAALRSAAGSHFGIRMRLSLAWLLLEDADLNAARALLEELEAIGVDWLEMDLVRYALAIVRSPDVLDPSRWAETVACVPALTHYHPWIADPQTARDLMLGRSRKLHALLVAV